MRKYFIVPLTAACLIAPAAQARPLDEVFEPAIVMKLDFGGRTRPHLGMGVQLNYSTLVRRAMGARFVSHETSLEAYESSIGSHLMEGPALAQLDFNRQGFHRALLVGLPLVTRHLRLRQTETSGAEPPAEEATTQEAEETKEEAVQETTESEVTGDSSRYDFSQWSWQGWSVATAGAVGVYLLVDDDDTDEPAPAGNGGGGGGNGVPCIAPGVPAGCTP